VPLEDKTELGSGRMRYLAFKGLCESHLVVSLEELAQLLELGSVGELRDWLAVYGRAARVVGDQVLFNVRMELQRAALVEYLRAQWRPVVRGEPPEEE
jgi:hypothetical protein